MTSKSEFLEAKTTVDDRAVNRRIRDRFLAALRERADRSDGPVRVLELGAGVGSMISRFAAWDGTPDSVRYRAVDVDPDVIAVARDRVPRHLMDRGYEITRDDTAFREDAAAQRDATTRRGDRFVATTAERTGDPDRLEISLEVADLREVSAEADAVIASALLDLVDLECVLPRIRSLLADGGLLYAPCTYAGATGFAPAHPLDDRIERLYHRHMDEVREQPGSSRAGLDLLAAAPAFDYEVLDAGGADWVVRPMTVGENGRGDPSGGTNGEYPAMEATFLRGLLETIDGALADFPADVLDPADRKRWVEARRTQVERGECSMIAHHLDVLMRA
ncbi:class I SAM-dependent methyltransferase [Halopenitus salinus]|uniref:Class I SAM-dependent methyltransferase n=1 Tax=Halopenitus salinus TaxID=1198295 RepID=A0ABD5US43_9EURY